MTNKRRLSGLWALGVAIVMASMGIYAAAVGRRDGVDKPSGASSSIDSSHVDAPSPAWPPPVIIAGDYAPSEVSLDELIEISPIIADVEVESIFATRFNTPSGAVPTQDPSGDEAGLDVFTPVALRVTRLYKAGPEAVDGFIVSEFGGQIDGISVLAYPLQPFTTAERPMVGVGFFESLAGESVTSSDGQWILTLQEVAKDRSLSTGLAYVPAIWHEVFHLHAVDTDYASAVGLRTQLDYTESDLRYVLYSSLNLPIPTKTPAPPWHVIP